MNTSWHTELISSVKGQTLINLRKFVPEGCHPVIHLWQPSMKARQIATCQETNVANNARCVVN